VLVPPQERRFREVTGLGDAPLEVLLTGWNKFVVLASDRVFLFPRHAVNVAWLERELAIYDTLRLPEVPRLLGRWDDSEVGPYPFGAVTRLPGERPTSVKRGLVAALGRVVAGWHAAPVPAPVRTPRPRRSLDAPQHRWLRRALDPVGTADAVAEAAARVGLDAPPLQELLGPAAGFGHVVVHGDLHEDQLLVVDGAVSGVLDWETARVDHPFWDFDFGEWGTGLWRRDRRNLDEWWHAMWAPYAAERGLDPDHRRLAVMFRLRDAWALTAGLVDRAVHGPVEEHTAAIRALLRDR
jgi:aminoglycoside phosphotransferase (APT) family kinase protein